MNLLDDRFKKFQLPAALFGLIFVCLLAPVTRGQDTGRFLSAGLGVGSFNQFDKTLSPLHYDGSINPLVLNYEVVNVKRAHSVVISFINSSLASGTTNSRSFKYANLAYHYSRFISNVSLLGREVAFSLGAGWANRLAGVFQTIVLPTYESEISSGFFSSGADILFSAETRLNRKHRLSYTLTAPALMYIIRPGFGSKWPALREGKIYSIFQQQHFRNDLAYRLMFSDRAGLNLQLFYAIDRLEQPQAYGAVSGGIILEGVIRL